MDFQLPEIGEGVYEAELVAWHVQPGDTVRRGQSLAEVVTDKASMELPSPFTGTIASLRAEPGDTVRVGEVILSYSTEAGETAEDAAAESPAPPTRGEAPPRKPKEKKLAEKRAPQPAAVEENGQGEEDRHPAIAGHSAQFWLQEHLAPMKAAAEQAARARYRPAVVAAPSVRRMARELGIDLTQVRGTGPGGRILVSDLKNFVAPAPAAVRPISTPRLDYGQPGTRLKFVGVRRLIAEHLMHAMHTAAHYSYMDECEVTELVRLREALKDPLARGGVKLTYLAFIARAAVGALKEVPIANATLDEEAGDIVLHDQYHLGFAVATPAGLLVPVIRNADQLDVPSLAREIERLSTAARTGKARPEDLKGSTFTITSIGNIGGLLSTPILNYPEVAILGVGKVVKRPVYDRAGNLRPADMLYLSFSFDHRVVDGAAGAAFGNAVIRRLQNPAALLLPDLP